jgi:uncharacterized protein (UPF0332 family)
MASRAEIELPEVVAHTAYYSMHHAAVAVLIVNGISVPKTHRGLVARLGQLDREQAWQARAEVALLGRALDRRLIADYEATDTLTVEHARSARDDASVFCRVCGQRIGLS